MLTVMAVEFPAVTVPLVGVAASQGPPLAVAAERAKESGQDPVAAVSVMLKVSAEGFVPCTTDLETVPGMPLISAGGIGSLSLVADRPMKPNRFVPWIQDVTQRYGTDILRMKGIASIEDDDRQFVVQSVHMLIEGGSQRPWKKHEARQTRLVFIGRDLPKDLLRQGFEACCA